MAETHDLKVVAPYFDPLLSGEKTFEHRRNDRAYQRGDRLRLWEYDPSACRYGSACVDRNRCSGYSGRMVEKVVSFVYTVDPRFGGIEPGYCVLALTAPEVDEVTP